MKRTGASHRLDRNLNLIRVRAAPRSSPIFIPLASIIHGAVLAPDPKNADEFIAFSYLNDDMFLRLKDITISGPWHKPECIDFCVSLPLYLILPYSAHKLHSGCSWKCGPGHCILVAGDKTSDWCRCFLRHLDLMYILPFIPFFSRHRHSI